MIKASLYSNSKLKYVHIKYSVFQRFKEVKNQIFKMICYSVLFAATLYFSMFSSSDFFSFPFWMLSDFFYCSTYEYTLFQELTYLYTILFLQMSNCSKKCVGFCQLTCWQLAADVQLLSLTPPRSHKWPFPIS